MAARDAVLSRAERAALEALLPSGANPRLPRGLLDCGFETFLSDFEREAAPPLRLGFRGALWFAAWVSPLLIGRLPPISRLAPGAREEALEAVFSSRFYLVRQLGLILKAVTSFCYGAHPAVRDAVGFPRQHDEPRARAA